MSEVAAANQHAWLREPVSAEEIATPDAGNRPLAHPYTKLMVANSSVNQGAAFLVTNLATARASGIAERDIVYIGEGAAARESDDFLKRADYASSPAMEASLVATLERNRIDVGGIGFAELYSCFPCVPKMARRTIGWPVDRPATVFGGLTFGGGPIGNYMSHAVGSMTDRLRAEGGIGLLFANGGFATYSHTILLGSEPFAHARFPHAFDVNEQANQRRGEAPPVIRDCEGSARIETYTVFHRRDGSPERGVVIARSGDGTRTLANVPGEDGATLEFLLDGRREPVGSEGRVTRGGSALQRWEPN